MTRASREPAAAPSGAGTPDSVVATRGPTEAPAGCEALGAARKTPPVSKSADAAVATMTWNRREPSLRGGGMAARSKRAGQLRRVDPGPLARDRGSGRPLATAHLEEVAEAPEHPDKGSEPDRTTWVGPTIWAVPPTLAIDVGTSMTRVATETAGLVFAEPSVVAIDTRDGSVVALGHEAVGSWGAPRATSWPSAPCTRARPLTSTLRRASCTGSSSAAGWAGSRAPGSC